MKLLSLVAILFIAVTSFANGKDNLGDESAKWTDLASGQHSFKSLGPEFYVDVPVRRIPDARIQLSFVNLQLVKKLGLELPADPQAAEAMLLDLFAWEVDPDKKSEKTWFATHYLDSGTKKAGEALGDGRALWTGEMKLKRADGKILYVDGVQKGVGVTPFAWTNNKTHRDGKQNTSELIISGIRSMADIANQLDSTGDILGFTISDGKGEPRSMTLRLGRQTRPAHVFYHSDTPKEEKKMMDYIVKRELGLPISTPVTDDMFMQWEREFARNNAEDTARVFALNAFYEHPTLGNKTMSGGSIDLNGRQYLDAYHVNMTHLHGRLSVSKAIQYQREYIYFINTYLRKANYRSNLNLKEVEAKMNVLFDRTFADQASRLLLNNLGLSEREINSVPEKVRMASYRATEKLMRAQGNETRDLIILNNGVVPAAFDLRKIWRGTFAAFAQPSAALKATAMRELYKVDYKWSASTPDDHPLLRAAFEASVEAVVRSLGRKVKPEWIAAAARRNRPTRFDSTSDGIWDQWAHPIRQKAESGTSNWYEISKLMEQAAATFVDEERPVRGAAMLKPIDVTPEAVARSPERASFAPRMEIAPNRLTAPTCQALFM